MTDSYPPEAIRLVLRLGGLELTEEASAKHGDELKRYTTLNERVARLNLDGPIPEGKPWEQAEVDQ